MSHSAASRAARPIPKGVTGNGPVPRTTSWVLPPWGPEPLLSPMVSCLHSHRTAECCVRYSRAGGMKVLKCGTATPSCSDAWTQESSRMHSHLPESRLCALGSSRIHSHLHEARNAFSISALSEGHRGSTRISLDLCECPPLAFALHCDPSQFRHFPIKRMHGYGVPGHATHEKTLHVPDSFAPLSLTCLDSFPDPYFGPPTTTESPLST